VKFSETLIFDHFFGFLNFAFDTKTTIHVEKKIFQITFVKRGTIIIKKIETITISYRAEIFFSYPLFFKKLRQNTENVKEKNSF
jgi:hypothetical protein